MYHLRELNKAIGDMIRGAYRLSGGDILTPDNYKEHKITDSTAPLDKYAIFLAEAIDMYMTKGVLPEEFKKVMNNIYKHNDLEQVIDKCLERMGYKC